HLSRLLILLQQKALRQFSVVAYLTLEIIAYFSSVSVLEFSPSSSLKNMSRPLKSTPFPSASDTLSLAKSFRNPSTLRSRTLLYSLTRRENSSTNSSPL